MSRLPDEVLRGSSLREVASAIAHATATHCPLIVYVEQRGADYRWSPAHRGGPYPLLRTVAKMLGVDHHQLVLPFRQVDELTVAADPESPPPDRSVVLEFDEPATAEQVLERINSAFPAPIESLWDRRMREIRETYGDVELELGTIVGLRTVQRK